MRGAILFALAMTLVAPARAADLAVRSPIGVIFADPVVVAPPARDFDLAQLGFPIYAPPVEIQPLVNGYYGKPNSYYYSNYYGTSRLAIFSRLPYACAWHGYC